MFSVKDGLAFSAKNDGSVIILRNGGIIANLTRDDWVSIITHMAKKTKPLDEIHNLAERFHDGDPILK